jgi:hypothetical protein
MNTLSAIARLVVLKSIFLACLILCLASEVQATTLINNVKIYPYSDYSYWGFFYQPGSFAIDYHGAPEAVFTPISSSAYSFFNHGLAEDYAFYDVSLGNLIDLSYTQLATRLNSYYFNDSPQANFNIALNQSKYLGYWADIDYGTSTARDYFGWVRVTRTAAGLVASESATSVGKGIVVGSFEEIPEPSVSLLIITAMAPLLRRRRSVALTF